MLTQSSREADIPRRQVRGSRTEFSLFLSLSPDSARQFLIGLGFVSRPGVVIPSTPTYPTYSLQRNLGVGGVLGEVRGSSQGSVPRRWGMSQPKQGGSPRLGWVWQRRDCRIPQPSKRAGGSGVLSYVQVLLYLQNHHLFQEIFFYVKCFKRWSGEQMAFCFGATPIPLLEAV
jgi:hypothetical protein